MFSHSTLELVQGVLVHVHTTFLSSLIYYMTHHQKSYVTKSTNNYLTTSGDALTGDLSHHFRLSNLGESVDSDTLALASD